MTPLYLFQEEKIVLKKIVFCRMKTILVTGTVIIPDDGEFPSIMISL